MVSLAPLDLLAAWELPASRWNGLQIALVERPWCHFELPGEAARWDALAQWASEPNPFYESWYLLPALREADPHGEVSLLCLEADGQLAGLLPVRREASARGAPLPHSRNWLPAGAVLGVPLVAPGFETAFWRELLTWCDTRSGKALFLRLAHVPVDGVLHETLAKVLAEDGRLLAQSGCEQRAMIHTGLSTEEYRELSLSGAKRMELFHQRRRLEAKGDLTVERSTGRAGLAGWIAEFLALQRDNGGGAGAAAEALFAEALTGAARQGRLERLALRLDGRPLAMLATFLCPPGAFTFSAALDERFAEFAPGALLQQEALALLSRWGIDWIDSCARADHPLLEPIWRERRVVGEQRIAIGGAVRRLLFRAIAARETAMALPRRWPARNSRQAIVPRAPPVQTSIR